MIRKSGHRFSEKIMLKQKDRAKRYDDSKKSHHALRLRSRPTEKPGELPGFASAGISPLSELFSGGFSQGLVDAVLPAWSALPKIFEDVLVDAQRNEFPDARKGRLPDWCFGHFRRGPLERRFRFGARVA